MTFLAELLDIPSFQDIMEHRMVQSILQNRLNTNEKQAMFTAVSLLFLMWTMAVVYRYVVTALARSYVPFFARFMAPVLRKYSFGEEKFFSADGANSSTVSRRRRGFKALSDRFRAKFGRSNKDNSGLSDLRFCNANRVPFPFQRKVQADLKVCTVVTETRGPEIKDIDGNWAIDVSGSYGVNVVGYDKYKQWMRDGLEKVQDLGPVLGPLHPAVLENVEILKDITCMDEVSFHMSGTEAVMCAIRLARFNTQRKIVVQFGGAYHGWWDGVQPGPGNSRAVDDVITLKDMSPMSLRAIRARGAEIAAVIVNPFQAFHPNAPPPSDLVLMSNKARNTDNDAGDPYATWLAQLKEACKENDVPLIFDEVYSGFRLSPGGGAKYFGVQPDMIVYGKTLGGGMPVGVVCGKARLMRRFDPLKPLRVAYVIGTFSAHPAVMGAMNGFLKWVTSPEAPAYYVEGQERFDAFATATNASLAEEGLPLAINNLTTVFTFQFKTPSRYHWMYQYYLRDQGVNLSWVGTGRCIVSLDFTEEHYAALQERIVAAAKAMRSDGFWPAAGEEPFASNGAQGLAMAKELGYSTVVGPFKAFYDNIMEQKEIDHHASHSHLINQFMHLLSSSIFIWCYWNTFGRGVLDGFNGDWEKTVQLGLISLAFRQSGHYIFEPPCHDAEQAMLGFDTKSKVKICLLYMAVFSLFIARAVAEKYDYTGVYRLTDAWLLCTLLVVFGRVGVLWRRYSFTVSMHWWLKFMTDPFTDIPAYYRSLWQITNRRLVADAIYKSFPKLNPGYVGLTNEELPDGLNMGDSHSVIKKGMEKKEQ